MVYIITTRIFTRPVQYGYKSKSGQFRFALMIPSLSLSVPSTVCFPTTAETTFLDVAFHIQTTDYMFIMNSVRTLNSSGLASLQVCV